MSLKYDNALMPWLSSGFLLCLLQYTEENHAELKIKLQNVIRSYGSFEVSIT